jgi:hypothetical protein
MRIVFGHFHSGDVQSRFVHLTRDVFAKLGVKEMISFEWFGFVLLAKQAPTISQNPTQSYASKGKE